MRELERIVGNIGEAATGLEIVYWRTKDDPKTLLYGTTESGQAYTEFLEFVIRNLEHTLQALQAVQEQKPEKALEVLGKVVW